MGCFHREEGDALLILELCSFVVSIEEVYINIVRLRHKIQSNGGFSSSQKCNCWKDLDFFPTLYAPVSL